MKRSPAREVTRALDPPRVSNGRGAHEEPVTVHLRYGDVVAAVRTGVLMQARALRWDYVLRSRQRWADAQGVVEAHALRARRDLIDMGVSEEDLKTLARAGRVEVVVPFERDKLGFAWEARVFPWEHVLLEATRDDRGDTPLYVFRRLERRGVGVGVLAPPPVPPPLKLLYVESAPCGLRRVIDFKSERRLIEQSLDVSLGKADSAFPGADTSRAYTAVLEDPTLTDLKETLEEPSKRSAPNVVHVTGVDVHQGLELLRTRFKPEFDAWKARPDGVGARLHRVDERPRDGILFRDERHAPDPVEADQVARAWFGCRGASLVAFNMYNSGARLAALTVGNGVHAAVGFQDEANDRLCEMFFEQFYRGLREGLRQNVWRVHDAFEDALDVLRGTTHGAYSTGIVLWTDYPPPPRWTGARGSRRNDTPTLYLPEGEQRAVDYLEVDVTPRDEINYALLHNGRGLFETFKLRRKLAETVLAAVSVTVELHAGVETHPCRLQLDVEDRTTSLIDRLHVPLTSELARSLRERLRTSLYVEVAWGGQVVLRGTYSVILLPVDEWRDDDRDRSLLPSFVLPNDPIVRQIVARARNYLQALSDEVHAGFDGYQRDAATGEPGETYPGKPVDRQVQALWITLSNDFDLSYINPPPAYGTQSQRLRTPSAIIKATHGTCIDLALLLAACLEYVDIHPVVILLRGHAFPGYWRTQDAHTRFRTVQAPPQVDNPNVPEVERLGRAALQSEPWCLRRDRFNEIASYVDSGDLVLLETVELTSRSGFWQAVAEGERNLRSGLEFDALLDVVLARENRVTPLPVHLVEAP